MLLDPKKCFFLRREAQVLGHIVGSSQLKPNPEKISAVKNFPTQSTLKKLRGFLRLCTYYRRFIKNFSIIAKPLSDLLKKDQEFIWGDKQQEAFETLKEKLCTDPVLATPDYSRPFVITTDSSDWGHCLCV